MTTANRSVAEEMTALESRRGLVAAALGACEAELRELRGDKPGRVPATASGPSP